MAANSSFLILHPRITLTIFLKPSLLRQFSPPSLRRHFYPLRTLTSPLSVTGRNQSSSSAQTQSPNSIANDSAPTAGRSGSLSSPPVADVVQKIDVNPPKGTRDFPPEEMRLRSWLFHNFRESPDLHSIIQIVSMWLELTLIFGLILYKLIRSFFFNGDILDVGTSDSTAIFSVAHRLEKLYGGKAYIGLRIPDQDTSSRQNIDLVFVANGEAMVVSVKNLSGFVVVNDDGSWSCTGGSKYKTEIIPDPVVEAKRQMGILASYLEQRGVSLPEGFLTCKVVFPNPNFRTINSDDFPPEVITYEQWKKMRPDTKSMIRGWVKGTFSVGKKKESQEPMHQNLNFILNSAPIWDRVELRGNKYYLGEFVEFKGKHSDTDALGEIKRSKVSRMVVQKTSMLGFAPTRLQVLYCPRDIRSEGGTSSDWTEVTVRSSTEVVFQPQNSTKDRKFKLSSVLSLSLSA